MREVAIFVPDDAIDAAEDMIRERWTGDATPTQARPWSIRRNTEHGGMSGEPGHLVMALREHLSGNDSSVRAWCQRLREIGCSVAVDIVMAGFRADEVKD